MLKQRSFFLDYLCLINALHTRKMFVKFARGQRVHLALAIYLKASLHTYGLFKYIKTHKVLEYLF